MTTIEWTDETWNPTTGCDRVSEGCDNCYALTMAKRLKGMGSAKYQRDGDPRTSGPGFGLTVHPDTLEAPLRWRKQRRVFVNSMSDLFHKDVPNEFIARVFAVMALASWHTFQVLTKRPGRMASLLSSDGFRSTVWDHYCYDERAYKTGMRFDWPLPNVWLGTSVEDQRWADIRIPNLLDTPAAVRFLSCEPLLGPVDLGIGDPHRNHESDDVHGFPHPRVCLTCSNEDTQTEVLYWRRDYSHDIGLHWVIVGGESGSNYRPMDPSWVRNLRDECEQAGVPFFFKQWGGDRPKSNGRTLDGRTWDEYPAEREQVSA